MSFTPTLVWTKEKDNWYAYIAGMANVCIISLETTQRSKGLFSVIINDGRLDAIVKGDIDHAKAWTEGYIAGRFHEIKIEIRK